MKTITTHEAQNTVGGEGHTHSRCCGHAWTIDPVTGQRIWLD